MEIDAFVLFCNEKIKMSVFLSHTRIKLQNINKKVYVVNTNV